MTQELPNVRKLAEYINSQQNPEAFAKVLLALCSAHRKEKAA